jgi:hypothetical protein
MDREAARAGRRPLRPAGADLLGRPDTDPAGDVRALAGDVAVQRISFVLGFDYVVCAATKPASAC